MTRAADAPGQGRMRQHETAAFPPGLQAGGPQIGERGVGALPLVMSQVAGSPASALRLSGASDCASQTAGCRSWRRVAPPAHRARPGCRPASRGPACRAPARCARQRGQSCSTAHRASESWLGASAGGCRTVVFAPKPGSSRRPCALAGPTVAAITAGARKAAARAGQLVQVQARRVAADEDHHVVVFRHGQPLQAIQRKDLQRGQHAGFPAVRPQARGQGLVAPRGPRQHRERRHGGAGVGHHAGRSSCSSS